ncbi:hypothetical protein HOY82DRAFT_650565 [Tuber indicum]|nr:hypothetical protein HOY82DRAFT_650565 [Tuber indicum]
MISKPNITSHFRGRVEELKTADGIALYAYKSILDQGTGSCPDTPWDSFTTSTVERFLEHCYQGDYNSPKPVKLPLATPTSSVADDDEHADGVFHTGASPLPRFTTQDDAAEGSDTEDDDETDDSRLSGHPNFLDYSKVFFAHAELYILSQTQ